MRMEKTMKDSPSHTMPEKKKHSSKEQLLTLDEVGKRLCLSKRAIYRLIAKGELPKPLKVGGATRLCESDLNQFFETLTRIFQQAVRIA